MINVLEFIVRVRIALEDRVAHRSEAGFTTAELLGNAALGVVALVVIWQGLGALGTDVLGYMHDQIIQK